MVRGIGLYDPLQSSMQESYKLRKVSIFEPWKKIYHEGAQKSLNK